jgi:hypothetical protein
MAQVPYEVQGEHTDEHVGAHPGLAPVEDGTDLQVDGLQALEPDLVEVDFMDMRSGRRP